MERPGCTLISGCRVYRYMLIRNLPVFPVTARQQDSNDGYHDDMIVMAILRTIEG
jgi:hypothetical protein